LLILASVCGERSLRGMWLWAVNRWEEVREMMDLPSRPPALSTVWYILRKVDKQQLAEALGTEGSDEEIGVGKSLRGSKRRGQEALAVVTACGQKMKEEMR
ncbi:MAG: transposase family protein, partial [Deltaproteobacteria bacterium]|nr:transposase family protein [Deltaproteobacteria bacterium]